MNVFGGYAEYYDLLYKDKDYQAEVNFVQKYLERYSPQAKSILEFGCGSGGHAEHFAKAGYSVHGIDMSDSMLELANSKRNQLPLDISSRLKFEKGDIRTINLGSQYDVVLSLFHVMSYQVSNEDISAAFLNSKKHLKPGGVFIFDFWYGPGVIHSLPETRIKRINSDKYDILRMAEPELHPNENYVDVNYQVFVMNKGNYVVDNLEENHHMRYLFKPEIEHFLDGVEMSIVDFSEWMTGDVPTIDTWYAFCVAKQIANLGL